MLNHFLIGLWLEFVHDFVGILSAALALLVIAAVLIAIVWAMQAVDKFWRHLGGRVGPLQRTVNWAVGREYDAWGKTWWPRGHRPQV